MRHASEFARFSSNRKIATAGFRVTVRYCSRRAAFGRGAYPSQYLDGSSPSRVSGVSALRRVFIAQFWRNDDGAGRKRDLLALTGSSSTIPIYRQ